MTNLDKDEMRALYRDAADKQKQIKILTELYACGRKQVLDVLGVTGEVLQAPGATHKKRHPETFAGKKKLIRTEWPPAMRDDVCKAVLVEGITQREAAERFSVPVPTVGHWVIKAKETQKQFMDSADEILAGLAEQTDPAIDSQVQSQRIGAACAPMYNEDGKCGVPAVDSPEWTRAADEMVREHPAGRTREQMIVKPDFEKAVMELDAEIDLQLRITAIDDAVSGLRTACNCLAGVGVLEAPERELIGQIVVRAAAFRAGMLYATVSKEKARGDE